MRAAEITTTRRRIFARIFHRQAAAEVLATSAEVT
jgi:hypothetical protein